MYLPDMFAWFMVISTANPEYQKPKVEKQKVLLKALLSAAEDLTSLPFVIITFLFPYQSEKLFVLICGFSNHSALKVTGFEVFGHIINADRCLSAFLKRHREVLHKKFTLLSLPNFLFLSDYAVSKLSGHRNVLKELCFSIWLVLSIL